MPPAVAGYYAVLAVLLFKHKKMVFNGEQETIHYLFESKIENLSLNITVRKYLQFYALKFCLSKPVNKDSLPVASLAVIL